MSTAAAFGGKRRKNLTYDPDAWQTPQRLFDELNEEFDFTLDVATDGENAKVLYFITKERDALKKSWAGNVCFCNPPYSEAAKWVEKAHAESKHGATVVVLIKADTSTKWFREWWKKADEVRFLPRIQFVPPPGYTGKVGSPNMGHALLIFGGRKCQT